MNFVIGNRRTPRRWGSTVSSLAKANRQIQGASGLRQFADGVWRYRRGEGRHKNRRCDLWFDKNRREIWRQERPKLPNYTTPVVIEAAGKQQMVFAAANWSRASIR